MKRTHYCHQLRLENVGETVILKGWVKTSRQLGGLLFIDLRDRFGITQLVIRPESEIFSLAETVRGEYVIAVLGKVIERESKNSKIETGDIEVEVTELEIIGKSETTPLIIDEETDALEETRLKYRYLDLRRPNMQRNLMLRHQMNRAFRNFFDMHDFVEIETPIFLKPTPEGARDYLVPSRVHKGEFFALPQSPQMMKQLLMISGMERYYQLARCFRDEDLRADRQPEFTQLDIEMSFVEQEDVQDMMEDALIYMMKEVKGVDIPKPFPIITYNDSMERYGLDKPDTRFAMELIEMTDLVAKSSFSVFASADKVKALNVKNAADKYSRKEIDRLTEYVKRYRAKGLAWMKYENETFTGPIAKFFTEDELAAFKIRLNVESNDLLLFVADKKQVVFDALGNLRNQLAKELQLTDPNQYNFLWIVDWPLFEQDEETGKLVAAHHPFTKVRDDQLETFMDNPEEAIAQAYDVVLNGYELGSGSIRINDPELQRNMFRVMGFSEEEAQSQFGFLIDAYKYGAPNHAGIALGLDRIAMILTNSESIRDVIAFPKTASTRDLMMDGPVTVNAKHLDELGIKIK